MLYMLLFYLLIQFVGKMGIIKWLFSRAHDRIQLSLCRWFAAVGGLENEYVGRYTWNFRVLCKGRPLVVLRPSEATVAAEEDRRTLVGTTDLRGRKPHLSTAALGTCLVCRGVAVDLVLLDDLHRGQFLAQRRREVLGVGLGQDCLAGGGV